MVIHSQQRSPSFPALAPKQLCCYFSLSLSKRSGQGVKAGSKAGGQGRGARGCLGTSCMLRFSCCQYHVTKQYVISLQDSIVVDILGRPLLRDITECYQFHSWNAFMKLSFLSAVFLYGSLDRPFHRCPERLVGHGQRPNEPQCLLKN